MSAGSRVPAETKWLNEDLFRPHIAETNLQTDLFHRNFSKIARRNKRNRVNA